jgi:cysteine desulfurase
MVYFDHNATSPLDPHVQKVMLPYLASANASSRHSLGRHARQALDHAREQVAAAIGAHPSQVFFTSGGTEADNLAIQGVCAALKPSQIVVSAIEHPAVMRTALGMRRQGWQVRAAAVGADGRVSQEDVAAALQTTTGLVSVMMANNETGVLQDITTLAAMARKQGAVFHTDAVQALGKSTVNFTELAAHGVQAMSLSAHKIGGPQGAGALVLDKRVDIYPLQHGGGQEKGLRGGTENVAAIVGFGAACELLASRISSEARLGELRNAIEAGIVQLGGVVFGAEAPRLPNTSFFAFPNIDGETLVMALDRAGFAVASGSACSSDSSDPSPVLLAMGVAPELAQGAVRVSLGYGNSMEEIQQFFQALNRELSKLRQSAAIAA